MTETQMSKNEFFRQFIVKLCSSLDIKQSVHQCSLFIKESIPFDLLSLSLVSDKQHKLRYLIGSNANDKKQENQFKDVPPQVWANMQEHFKQNNIRLMYAPENREYAESIATIEEGVLENLDVSIPLVFKGKPIGFFILRLKKELTQDQIELLTDIQQPLAHAVAAALRNEDEEENSRPASFAVDMLFNRLKALKNIRTDKELAKKLDTLPSVIANSKVRNSIPYDKIILFCQREKISLDFIFMHNPFILSSRNKNDLYKAVLSCGMKDINATEVEELLKLPHGSLDIYLEKCKTNSGIIPPIEKLSSEALQSFHDALRNQRIYGGSFLNTCNKTINISMASGVITKNGNIAKTGRSLCFCKELAEKLVMPENVFAYTVEDDSMAPTLISGDLVFIDPDAKKPKKNGIYAVALGDSIFVKRLMPTAKEALTMICDNKIYPADELHPDNVIGEVIWHARTLRPITFDMA